MRQPATECDASDHVSFGCYVARLLPRSQSCRNSASLNAVVASKRPQKAAAHPHPSEEAGITHLEAQPLV